MPRIVELADKGPIKVDPQDKPVFICACGLTKNRPFCDGSHKPCQSEDDAKLYRYNNDGTRNEITPA